MKLLRWQTLEETPNNNVPSKQVLSTKLAQSFFFCLLFFLSSFFSSLPVWGKRRHRRERKRERGGGGGGGGGGNFFMWCFLWFTHIPIGYNPKIARGERAKKSTGQSSGVFAGAKRVCCAVQGGGGGNTTGIFCPCRVTLLWLCSCHTLAAAKRSGPRHGRNQKEKTDLKCNKLKFQVRKK